MKVAVVNFNSNKSIEKNILLMKKYISSAIDDKVNFIIFPELCLTGYQYFIEGTRNLCKEKLENFINQLIEISFKNNLYICFGTPYYSEDRLFNSAIIICKDKTMKIYNKIHLYGDEHKIFTKGDQPLIIETEFGRIGFGICYDTISFPELIRYYANNGVNLYINISALQLSSSKESKAYVKRAIEYHVQSNGIYLASSNTSGVQNNVKFLGGSCIVGPERRNENPVQYYCNPKLSPKSDFFVANIELSNHLRFIFDGNRFNQIPDFNKDLYKSWYS